MAHTRYYNSKRQRLPSVTTVLPSPDLKRWAWIQGQEGKNPGETSRASMWRGTLVHLACEMENADAACSLCLSFSEVSAVVKNYTAYQKWRLDNNITILPERKEVKLVSELRGYGGTCDFVCTATRGLDEVETSMGAAYLPRRSRLLVDIKTSKAIYTESVLPQLAAYAGAWIETHPDEPLNGVAALHLRDGVATLHRWSMEQCVPALWYFLACLEVYEGKKVLKAMKARVS